MALEVKISSGLKSPMLDYLICPLEMKHVSCIALTECRMKKVETKKYVQMFNINFEKI